MCTINREKTLPATDLKSPPQNRMFVGIFVRFYRYLSFPQGCSVCGHVCVFPAKRGCGIEFTFFSNIKCSIFGFLCVDSGTNFEQSSLQNMLT